MPSFSRASWKTLSNSVAAYPPRIECGAGFRSKTALIQPRRQWQFMRGTITVPLGRNSCT
jgi:hypothetical protein